MNLNTDTAKSVLTINPNWDANDKKAIKVIIKAASSAKVTNRHDGVRFLDAEGKSLAWVNRHFADFAQGEGRVTFSTSRSNRVAA